MAKNLNNIYEVFDLSKVTIEELSVLLDAGKTLLVAAEKGINVNKSLKEGYSNYLQANVELKEEKENCGTCGCGKPANILFYAWR